MIRIGVTGSEGLIGWHFKCFAFGLADVEIVAANRETFSSEALLDAFVKDCDAIVHFAGMNRGTDDEIAATNPHLANSLVDAMQRMQVAPHVVYSSSTHIDKDSVYGNSKKLAGEVFEKWADQHNAIFTNMVLPHVFGEQGKPFYNSVVSTFCHQVANGEEPKISQDGDLELLHAQEVCHLVYDAIKNKTSGVVRPSGKPLRVSELLAQLKMLAETYTSGVIPDLRDNFALRLFNTYRSYLYPKHYPVQLVKNTDNRGTLVESVKTLNGGQAFFSSTKPGITRGDHFHYNKIERFLVVEGSAVIRLRRLFSDQIEEFHVSGDEPVYIDMPTFHTHNITNTGNSNILTLFWAHEIFNPEHPDTLHEPVENGATI